MVELIVVLVILALLAALLIPALTGYIDKAKQKSIIEEARGVWTAAQAGASEYYGLYATDKATKESMKFNIAIDGVNYTKIARISNCSFYDEQHKWHTTNLTASQKITQEILLYLDSKDPNNSQYSFGNTNLPQSGATLEQNMKNNFGSNPPKNAVFIQLFYDQTFKVVGVNFGKNGYLVTMTANKTTCEKNGRVFRFTAS